MLKYFPVMLLPLLLVDCSSEAWEEDDPVEAYKQFLRAIERHDGETIWEMLPDQVRTDLDETARKVSEYSDGEIKIEAVQLINVGHIIHRHEIGEIQIIDDRSSDDDVFLAVELRDGRETEVHLFRQRERWVVDIEYGISLYSDEAKTEGVGEPESSEQPETDGTVDGDLAPPPDDAAPEPEPAESGASTSGATPEPAENATEKADEPDGGHNDAEGEHP